jgi:hypothetical protein
MYTDNQLETNANDGIIGHKRKSHLTWKRRQAEEKETRTGMKDREERDEDS